MIKRPSSAWSLRIGIAILIVPMTLTLALTGRNEDRVPPAVEQQVGEDVAARRESLMEKFRKLRAKARRMAPVVARTAPVAEPTAVEAEPGTAEVVATTTKKGDAAKSPVTKVSGLPSVPVFAGFEDPRFQMHDKLIAKCVAAFNAHREAWAGATPGQASQISPITTAQVKSQMIQESGGANALSRAAWRKDPLQANVPGDWSSYKKYVGLHRPRNRNEGSLEANLKAGIMILARKGFSPSAQPAANRPSSRFGGWRQALQRYNGRSDLTPNGVPYRDVYASRILQRAAKPSVHQKIPIKPTKSRRRKR